MKNVPNRCSLSPGQLVLRNVNAQFTELFSQMEAFLIILTDKDIHVTAEERKISEKCLAWYEANIEMDDGSLK